MLLVFFFSHPIFFLPSVFVAGLRPENMAAVLHGCGGRSQTKCQLGHIVATIKAPPLEGFWSGQGALWDNINSSKRRRTQKAALKDMPVFPNPNEK